MFQSIRSIRDYGVFSSFTPSQDGIPAFSDRNLIYGWNYSGKTTLSRVFQSFERKKPHPDFIDGSFSLVLDDGTVCSAHNLDSLPFPVRVFNADFIRQNLRWEEGVEPILIVGEENIALRDELARLERWLDRRRAFRSELHRRRSAISSELEDAGTQAARVVRETLGRTPFNRSPHLQAVIDDLGTFFEDHILPGEQLSVEHKKLTTERREAVSTIAAPGSASELQEEVSTLLGKTARQEILNRLRDDPAVERWVQQGLTLHEDSTKCLFCDQDLPTDLLKSLERHFSEAFRALQEEIRSLIGKVRSRVPTFNPPDKASLYADLQARYQQGVDLCRPLISSAAEELTRLEKCLEAKLEDPVRVFEPPEGSMDPDREGLALRIGEVNAILEEHNRRCREFEEEKIAAQEVLIRHQAATFIQAQNYHGRLEEDREVSEREARLGQRIQRISARQEQIQAKLGEEVGGAGLINDYLRQYFGTQEITVGVTPVRTYTLKRRNGHLAKNLSEGERTAIAFSYFLASLNDRALSDQRPVVYIDDPVSSLDSNHLFGTFSTIKSICSDCRQLFVSTHNFGFFRLMKGDAFFQEVAHQKKRASWYLVRRSSEVEAQILDLPDSLRRYNSEYHYLFDLAYRFHQDPEGNGDLLGMMPNILRRILEVYTSFRVPDTKRDLFQRLAVLDPVREARRNAVYKFVNHGSHSDSIEFGVEFPQSDECRRVVQDVFDIFEENDEEHFKGMCGIVAPVADAGEGVLG